MTFRFIHTADWQLGAPFGGFSPDLAGQLKAARLSMIDAVAKLAVSEDALHVIVAGDVWDSEQPSDQTIRQPLDSMGEASAVTWWLMPGNHDPHRPNLLWDRIAKRAPENVRLLLDCAPTKIAESVFLLPAPWDSKAPGRDITAYMDAAETEDGGLRIGVAHGSVIDFSTESGDRSVIAKDRAERAGLDYLALGDWHGVKEMGPKTWYSGTPEPDRFRRNEPGFALLVEVDSPGAPPSVTPHRMAQFDWRIADLDVRSGVAPEKLLEEVVGNGRARQMLLQLNVSGRLAVSERLTLDHAIEDLAERVAFLDVRTGGLDTLIENEDLDLLDRAGSVRMAAEALLEKKNDADLSSTDRTAAARALNMLFTMSAASSEQAS